MNGCNSIAPTKESSSPDTETTTTTSIETQSTLPDSNLIFEDDFDGTTLDNTKWELCPEWERGGGMSVWDDTMTSLDGNGHLVLRAVWDPEAGRVKAGAVRTLGLFSAGYGYYEASIKFPVAHGIWGAFWMMCGDVSTVDGSAADGVEIDIVESIHNEYGACNHALHWDGYGDGHKTVSSGEILDHSIYDGEFHTFALERTEKAYVFYIDGKMTSRVSPQLCAPCPEDGYMKLTIESAEWAGGGTQSCISSLPAEMIVDYVRVYKEKP
jgi:beta-glucanase (GH16 family)